MSMLGKFIADNTPKMNREVLEGFCYHRLQGALKYVVDLLQYVSTVKTKTHLRFIDYRVIPPEEYTNLEFRTKNSRAFDMAHNDLFLVEFLFQYGDEEEVRSRIVYLPYMEKGNMMTFGGKPKLITPTLADKVISIGSHIIFIDIKLGKHSFSRLQHTILEGGLYRNVPVIHTVLYNITTKRLRDTTKAKSTVMHYLLSQYGYSKTMELLIGFVPVLKYDIKEMDGYVVYRSRGRAPDGWLGNKEDYKPDTISVLVPEELNSPEVRDCIGNLYYIIDHFPRVISISEVDQPLIWRRLIGEIILSGEHGIGYILEKMGTHFEGHMMEFDTVTMRKLRDIGVESRNLMELLVEIFKNFNLWMSQGDSRSLYHSKSLEVESYLLSPITNGITNVFLAINKEEFANEGRPLEPKVVDSAFNNHFRQGNIFRLRKEKHFVFSVDDPTDHLYFKRTVMVNKQESDFTNVDSSKSNTSTRGKLVASMATFGSILNLSKKNPTPEIRQNPYVTIDPKTLTILPDPVYGDIVSKTDKMLADTNLSYDIKDITEDGEEEDLADELEIDFYDYEDSYELDGNAEDYD